MRRTTSLMLSFVVVPAGVVAAPVVARPAPEPRPVAPEVQEIRLPAAMTTASAAASGRRTLVATSQQDTEDFSTLGVTWRNDPGVGELVVTARTRSEDGGWSAWQELEAEAPAEGSEAASGRGGTEPVWVGPSDGVQVRVEVLAGEAPTDLRLALVDPGASAADATGTTAPPSTAQAATAMPVIRTRKDWGADESLRSGSPSYASSLYAVTVHHTAGSNDYTSDQVPSILRGIYAYHTQSRGWSDVGYNVLVDKFGRAWEGRAGGLQYNVIGAHAGGFNTGTVGISVMGEYTSTQFSSAAKEAVAQVAAWKLSLWNRDPQGTVTLTSGGSTKYSSGTKVTLDRIHGHRDVSSTACPGNAGYAALEEIRTRAGQLVAGSPATDPLPAASPSPTATPTTSPSTSPTTSPSPSPTTSPTTSPTPSPTPTPKPPFGAFDSATPGPSDVEVSGWAIDPDASTFTTVSVSVDGKAVKDVLADDYRADLKTAYPQYSPNHGFAGSVPAAAGTRKVCITARNQNSGSDVSLGCKTVTVGATSSPSPTPSPTPTTGPVQSGTTPPPPARATDHSCPSGVTRAGFSDTAGTTHETAIDCLVWWEVSGGTSSTTYTPGAPVTRAHMASFLARMILESGGTLPSSPRDAFTDDETAGAHELAINQLAAAGIVSGSASGTYNPQGLVTRGQMATFLTKAYTHRTGRTLTAGADYFADDDGDVHEANIQRVAKAGFTGGTADGRFRPSATTDRGQMASFLTRVLDLLVEAGDAPPRG